MKTNFMNGFSQPLKALGVAVGLVCGISAFADESEKVRPTCENFRIADAADELVTLSEVENPESLTERQAALVHLSVMAVNTGQVFTLQQALDTFFDVEYSGDSAGSVLNIQLENQVTEGPWGGVVSFNLVTYFPGDNEYGALFHTITYEDGLVDSTLIGTVNDSDILCLTWGE